MCKWYTKVQKVKAETVKTCKTKSLEYFGVKLVSDLILIKEIFWQIIQQLYYKKSSSTSAIKNSAKLLPSTKSIFGRRRKYFADLNLVTKKSGGSKVQLND